MSIKNSNDHSVHNVHSVHNEVSTLNKTSKMNELNSMNLTKLFSNVKLLDPKRKDPTIQQSQKFQQFQQSKKFSDFDSKLCDSEHCNIEHCNIEHCNTDHCNSDQSKTVQSNIQNSDDHFTSIRFQIINRKNFRLRSEDAERSLIPIVLVGNKRKACNFIQQLNEISSEYRTLLDLRRGELIPFKMLDADSFTTFSMESLKGREIKLLCIYSDIFDQDVEKKIRDKLVNMSNKFNNHDDKFIKTISTIYLRNANSNLKITRVKHRKNEIETQLNFFKTGLPEISWRDIITLKIDIDTPMRYYTYSNHKYNNIDIDDKKYMCPICINNVEVSNCSVFTCGHSVCLKCTGSITSITKRCPFCMKNLQLSDITLKTPYVPSLFSSIKELLIDMIPDDMIGAQSVIYVQDELSIQHILNFLIQNIESLEDRIDILNPTFNFSLLTPTSKHYYFLACSNNLITMLPNLTTVITSTDNDYCKNMMLDFRSYGKNYGKVDQELVVLNAE